MLSFTVSPNVISERSGEILSFRKRGDSSLRYVQNDAKKVRDDDAFEESFCPLLDRHFGAKRRNLIVLETGRFLTTLQADRMTGKKIPLETRQ